MAKNRRHGEGWIEKSGDRYRARYWRDGKKVTVAMCDSMEEADQVLLVYAEGLAKESPIAGETLRSWSEKWLDARETDGVHRSVTRDRHAFKRVTRSEIANLPLASITPRDVRDWVAAQVKSKAARQTVANALNLLRVCLEAACEANKIQVKVPRIARTTDEWTWLRPAEMTVLLAAKSEDRDIFAVAIFTGVRAGELFGLEWRDVDFAHGVVTIRHSWKGSPTKGGRVRRVTLMTPAIEALLRQLERSGNRRNVFPARDGEARSKDQMPDLSAALVAAGITRHVRFHDLRHSCASALIQGTWSPKWIARPLRLEEIKEWLGHTSIMATQRYAHLAPEAIAGLVVKSKKPTKKQPPSPELN
jgi:integrase